MDYMKSDSYDTIIIKAIKQEMIEAKKSTGKIKFKWEEGNETLPEGWKIRQAKGTGRHSTIVEYILSADMIQFKSRFEALHYMISNNYDAEKIKGLKKNC